MTAVSVDLAKRVFQVAAEDRLGEASFHGQVKSREASMAHTRKLPRSVEVLMEACPGAQGCKRPVTTPCRRLCWAATSRAQSKEVRDILKSPVGRKIGLTAIGRDTKIRLALRAIPGEEPTFFRNVEGDSNLITYSLDVDGFKRGLGPVAAELGGLDTILMHEIGHTAVGAAAMGIPLHSWTFSMSGEFDAVRRFENPYRQWAGYRLRSTYGGEPIPHPLAIKP